MTLLQMHSDVIQTTSLVYNFIDHLVILGGT